MAKYAVTQGVSTATGMKLFFAAGLR